MENQTVTVLNKYYVHCTYKSESSYAYDYDRQRFLWENTERESGNVN